MFRRIAMLHGASPAITRAVCIPCLALIALLATSAPLRAALEPESSTIRVIPVRLVDTAPSSGESPIGDSHSADGDVSEGSARPLALGIGNGIGDPYKPGTIVIGRGQSDLKTMPGRLAAAGLLLIPLDKSLVRAFPNTPPGRSSDGLTEAVNKLGSKSFLLATLGGIYAVGDSYDKQTARLAFAALANAAIATQGLKLLSGRERPGLSGGLVKFHGPGSIGNARQSFPSGHTSSAFAVATVLAARHPKQKWLYYGLAAAVGFARIRKSAHFPSDVLAGAGIGIYAGNNALRHGPRIFVIKL